MHTINPKPIKLFSNKDHSCFMFNNLVTGHGVQANQFMLIDHNQSLLLDPGGDLVYMPLTIAVSQLIKIKELNYIFASHQDPDIIASIDRWLMHTQCKVAISKLWGRFLPHFISSFMGKNGADLEQRIIEIPDAGQVLRLGQCDLLIIPAHFLHSVGNFHLYDPVSKILFSGDMGASMNDDDSSIFVEDFDAHIPSMQGFHERYMVSGKVTSLWANMVRKLDLEIIVPQHGKAFKGTQVINDFLEWASELECGIDLLRKRDFKIPC